MLNNAGIKSFRMMKSITKTELTIRINYRFLLENAFTLFKIVLNNFIIF